MYNFISIFRHGRCWQEDSYRLNRHKKVHSALRTLTITEGVFFCAITFHAMENKTANSFSSLVTDLECIPPEIARLLLDCGIPTPGMLLNRSSSPAALESLAKRLVVQASDIASWSRCAERSQLKGMNAWNANVLMRAGIKDITGLASQDPATPHAILVREYGLFHEKQTFPLREAILRIWIREAQKKTGGSG